MRSLVSSFWNFAKVSFSSLGLLSLLASPTLALESIALKPSFLLENPLPLSELEAFALEGKKSSDIQFLLDLISGSSTLQESDLQQFLGNSSEVNGVFVADFFSSAIGEVLLQELVRILQPDPVDPVAWQAFQSAMIAASADNQSSVIEVLKNYEPNQLVVDVSRIGKLQGQVQKDIADMQLLLGIEKSGDFNAGVAELFCTPEGAENLKGQELLNLLFTFTASGQEDVADVFDTVITVDPALVNRFLSSYFGSIFLRHLALTLEPGDESKETIAALKQALSATVKDGKFSVMESLTLYQSANVSRHRDKLIATVTRIQGDIQDYQQILGIDGSEDINAVIRTIVCEPNEQSP